MKMTQLTSLTSTAVLPVVLGGASPGNSRKGSAVRFRLVRSVLRRIAILSLVFGGSASGADLFNGRELSLSMFGNYVDKDDSKIAPGAGVSYFLTRHLGVGAFTHWENYDGTFIDNLSGEAYFRLPLENLRLAPYALVAVGYSFETEESFGSFGAGAEWRINEKWGVFSDLRWQINGDTDDGVAVRLGARFVF